MNTFFPSLSVHLKQKFEEFREKQLQLFHFFSAIKKKVWLTLNYCQGLTDRKCHYITAIAHIAIIAIIDI
jgi:hypothetical protein